MLEQGTSEWFDATLSIPMVSDMARVVTHAQGTLAKHADGYIAQLLARLVTQEPERLGRHWMERGPAIEPEARDWYSHHFDRDVEQVGLVLNSGAGYSPDGLIGEDGCLAIQCPKHATHVLYLMAGALPDCYKPFVHGALVVSERAWCDFVSYCPPFEPLCVRVGRDEYTDKVANALADFLVRLSATRERLGL